jgi:hypothetical protein
VIKLSDEDSTTVTIQNLYAYLKVLKILMPSFRILVILVVTLVDRFEVFEPANQRKNNAVETSNFAVLLF